MIVVAKIRDYVLFHLPEDSMEPPCIHIESFNRDRYARFWLNPLTLARASGFRSGELGRATDLVMSHLTLIKKSWETNFEKRSRYIGKPYL